MLDCGPQGDPCGNGGCKGKKGRIGLILGLVAAAAVITAGVALAQSEEPPDPARPCFGWGKGWMGPGPAGGREDFDAAAEALGLTPTELAEALHGGKMLAEVAEEQGVALEDLQQAMASERASRMREAIERAVESEELTREHADWLLEGLDQGFMPMRPRRGGFGGGRGAW